MRQIGSLSDEVSAERFVDYLTTISISSVSEEDNGQWLIWIKDENQVDSARVELDKYAADPEASIYKTARQQAHEIRSEQAKKRIQAHKNFHHARDAWNAPLSKRAPIVFALIVICIALAVMGGGQVLYKGDTVVDRFLMFADDMAYFRSGDSDETRDPFVSIRSGQIWRVITPALLHGGILHLAFNMYWMYVLGAQIEAKLGRWKFLGLTVAGAAFPNVLQAILQGPGFLGISGVVFTYFGFIILRRSDGYLLSNLTIYLILGLFLLDFTPFSLFGHVAVWAHAGGLMTGAFFGYLPDWLKGARR